MFFHIEYSILRRIGGGAPYIGLTYNSLQEAINILEKNFIYEDIKKKRIYFVDNNFYNNKYECLIGISNFNYYKIVARKITDWVGYEEISEFNYDNISKNNIIEFPNFA